MSTTVSFAETMSALSRIKHSKAFSDMKKLNLQGAKLCDNPFGARGYYDDNEEQCEQSKISEEEGIWFILKHSVSGFDLATGAACKYDYYQGNNNDRLVPLGTILVPD